MPRKYIYLIVTYIVTQFSIILARPFIPADMTYEELEIFAANWSIVSFSVATILSIIILRDEIKEFFQLKQKKIGSIILWSVLGVFMAMFAQALAVLVEFVIFRIPPGSENTMNLTDTARQTPLFIMLIAVLGPILEELVFRKAIFGSLNKRMNFFLAALISGLVFALVHQDFDHILIYTSVGMVFAFLYVHTKRIIVPIIAHMSMNSIALIAQFSQDPEEIRQIREQFEQLMMILIGG
ncbi:type II CAAX endopeptidase family protein [Gracilibacillus sp. S3-1-1]|uniref:Type II CAAX endopeptidase family protein n=1 Tax=Gracilibacillus pellucidus TaxID=3095368 RepID=A0ACC6M9M9_9BACI|nr:type II CAAX endopeptidase family protein [Gracilibacillus sp. S3-1-1]MDX8047572.1 type II CAAX endopeptidase family protein [Gracilibacillus sp. S3-1-1]